MKKLSIIALILLAVLVGCTKTKKEEESPVKQEQVNWNYPETKRELVTDDYFGTKVEDYYRHLENNDSEDVQKTSCSLPVISFICRKKRNCNHNSIWL